MEEDYFSNEEIEEIAAGWLRVVDDYPYMKSACEHAAKSLREEIRKNIATGKTGSGTRTRAAQPRNAGDVAPMGDEEKSSGSLAQRA